MIESRVRLYGKFLRKTAKIPSFKLILFESISSKSFPRWVGERICEALEDLPLLKSCEAGILAMPHAETEASFPTDCPSCQLNEDLPLAPIALGIRSCGLVSADRRLKEGKLTDYWAQELMGGDLLREELEKHPPPEAEHFISVLDSSEIDHDRQVKNLISDEGTQALLPELGSKIPIFHVAKPDERNITLGRLQELAPPHFVNVSMDVGFDSSRIIEALGPQAVIVIASGNSFPEEMNDNDRQLTREHNTLWAGSFSPDGFVSQFSQEGEGVSILAPSDHYITSSAKGKDKTFGGTSGAAPLVTGALAAFEWLSGHQPTRQQAKLLLEKSAIPIPNSQEEPQKNGKGLLNAYKIGQVALRLREKCGSPPLSSSPSLASCFEQEIAREENYQFTPNSDLEEELEEVFPRCAHISTGGLDREGGTDDCEKVEEVFKKLKAEVLLSPERGELWESLSCIYRKAGFLENSTALDAIALANGPREELLEDLKSLLLREPWREGLMRTVANLIEPEERASLFSELYSKISSRGRDFKKTMSDWIDVAQSIGGREGIDMLALSAENEDSSVKRQTVFALGQIDGEEDRAIEILTTMAEDPKISFSVANSLSRLGDIRGVPLMENLIQREEDSMTLDNIKRTYYRFLGTLLKNKQNTESEQLGEDTFREVYEKAAKVGVFSPSLDENDGIGISHRFLKLDIISISERMGERGREVLQQLAEQDPEPDIRKRAKQTLDRLN